MLAEAFGEQALKTASAKGVDWSGQEPAWERSPYEQGYIEFWKPKK